MKKLLVLLAIVLALIPLTVLAADYAADITVTENGTDNYTMYSGNASVDFDNLVTRSFVTATGLDTRVQEGGSDLPYMASDNMLYFALPLNESTLRNLEFVTGEDLLSSFDIIPGYGGYITRADNAGLELGNYFTIVIPFYNTNEAGCRPFFKSGAADIGVPSAGTLWATFTNGATTTGTPSDNGDSIAIPTLHGASTHWEAVQTDDADTSYVEVPADSTYYIDYYDTSATLPTGAVEISVTVNTRWRNTSASPDIGRLYNIVRLSGNDNLSSLHTSSTGYNGAWETTSDNLSRPGGGSWTIADVADLQIGIKLYSGVGATSRATQVWATISYKERVTATGQSAGAVLASISANTTHVALSLDGSVVDTKPLSAGVTNTANSYQFLTNTPYADNISISINGTPVLLYQPTSYILGRNLLDEVGSNNGTFTWGANPASVAITLGALLPSTQGAASSAAVEGASGVSPTIDAPTMTPSIGNEGTTFPLYGMFKSLFDQLEAEGGPSISMPYFWGIVALVIFVVFSTWACLALGWVMGALAGMVSLAAAVFAFQGGAVLPFGALVTYTIGIWGLAFLKFKWGQSSL